MEVVQRGEDLWERVPRDEIRRGLGSARDSMEDMVESELRSMQKALRRRRNSSPAHDNWLPVYALVSERRLCTM